MAARVAPTYNVRLPPPGNVSGDAGLEVKLETAIWVSAVAPAPVIIVAESGNVMVYAVLAVPVTVYWARPESLAGLIVKATAPVAASPNAKSETFVTVIVAKISMAAAVEGLEDFPPVV